MNLMEHRMKNNDAQSRLSRLEATRKEVDEARKRMDKLELVIQNDRQIQENSCYVWSSLFFFLNFIIAFYRFGRFVMITIAIIINIRERERKRVFSIDLYQRQHHMLIAQRCRDFCLQIRHVRIPKSDGLGALGLINE